MQIDVLSALCWATIGNISYKAKKKHLITSGDFNLFFDLKLDAQSGNFFIKNESLAKIIKFKGTYKFVIYGE